MRNNNKKASMDKKNSIFSSFKCAFCGIITALKKERNIKIHFVAMFIVIVLGFLLKISQIEWIVCLILFALVIGAELINSAIESTVDLAMPDIHEKAKFAKDVAAGAVLFIAIVSLIIGIIIFMPKLILFIKNI